tara:strand:- start:7 stop:159 length:153 start_codon:yes stop_codon:yes gene_type:complete
MEYLKAFWVIFLGFYGIFHVISSYFLQGHARTHKAVDGYAFLILAAVVLN